MESPPVTYIYQLNTLTARFSKGPVTFLVGKKFGNQNLLNL